MQTSLATTCLIKMDGILGMTAKIANNDKARRENVPGESD